MHQKHAMTTMGTAPQMAWRSLGCFCVGSLDCNTSDPCDEKMDTWKIKEKMQAKNKTGITNVSFMRDN